jgi:hypothetical protein
MERGSIGKLILMAASCLGIVTDASPSEACFLFDCLFGRKSTPVSAYYPTTAAAATAPATGACGAAQCEQTVVNYMPEVSYRTVWQPVPVTTYRRTVSYNPANGLPMTCTQPCTTYTYQARRVPYTSYRPVYTTVPVTMPAVAATPVASANYAAPTTDCGCSGVAPAAWTGVPAGGQPYYPGQTYATPGTAAPGYSTADPAGTTPWERVEPGSGSAPSPIRGYDDPANRTPQIDPSIQPDNDFGASRSLQQLPSVRREYADDRSSLGGDTTRAYRPSASDALGERGVSPSTSSLGSLDSLAPQDSRSSFGSLPPVTSTQDSQPAARSTFDLRPLPNLDPPPSATEQFNSDAPPLLNDPRSNTARAPIRPIPTRWASNRITWPVSRVNHDQPVNEDVRAAVDTIDGDTATTRRVPAARNELNRLDPRRVQNVRFDSDSSGPTNSPSTSPPTNGWRSTRR